MREVATLTSCFGETSIYRISSGFTIMNSPLLRPRQGGDKPSVSIQGSIGLGDRGFLSFDLFLFIQGEEVSDIVRHLPVGHFPIRRFNESIIIHPGKRAERGDQANIGAFRCLDGTDPAVVGRVNVPDLKPRPSPG